MLNLKHLGMQITGVEGDRLTRLKIDRKAVSFLHTLDATLQTGNIVI